ncbi:MAG: hypothetical protein VW312_06060, partial [Opitutales bacterium]
STNDVVAIKTANSERARVDASGNVLVGTTDTVPSNNGSSGDAGAAISPDGVFRAARSGNVSLDINRMDSDGEIAAFRKDGTTVGSLNTNGGAFVVKGASTSGPVQLQTHDGNEDIEVDPDGFIKFETAGSERMRIDANGKVLMGASSAPNQACEVFINDTLMIGRGDQNITGSLSTSGLIINAQTGSFIMTLYDDNDTANPRLTLNRNGNFAVTGSLSKGSGSFRINHPLPAKNSTHHLIHSFIEGPQADLIYRGKVDLVAGSATVNIDTASGMTDGTFVLLCDDVQCFTSNEDGFTAVKGSVSGNTLTITAEDNTCTDTISWMVIGERKDQHMLDTDWTDDNGKVIVEPLKE